MWGTEKHRKAQKAQKRTKEHGGCGPAVSALETSEVYSVISWYSSRRMSMISCFGLSLMVSGWPMIFSAMPT